MTVRGATLADNVAATGSVVFVVDQSNVETYQVILKYLKQSLVWWAWWGKMPPNHTTKPWLWLVGTCPGIPLWRRNMVCAIRLRTIVPGLEIVYSNLLTIR